MWFVYVSYPLSSVSGRRPSFWKQFWISLCYWTLLVCPLLKDSPQSPPQGRSFPTHFQDSQQASSHGPLPLRVSESTAARVPTNSISDWWRDRITDELNLRALNTFFDYSLSFCNSYWMFSKNKTVSVWSGREMDDDSVVQYRLSYLKTKNISIDIQFLM